MASRIEMWPLARLVAYGHNSRTHSAAQIRQIANSIERFGFTQPILVNEADGGILAGQARLQAARLLALEAVPVIPLAHLSDAQRRAYIVADNQLGQIAGWDETLLQLELERLHAEGFDLDVVGFSDQELDKLMREAV